MPQTPPFMSEPARGRVFEGTRQVRATDVTPAGRLRLDAVMRYLQDVAEDDVAGTGWRPPYGWLLRSCAISVRDYPGAGSRVILRTFCSAMGPRWAERTTTIRAAQTTAEATATGTPLMQATALWVAVDRETGQPCPLGDDFHRFYGEAAQGRRATARLGIPAPDSPPPDGTAPDGTARKRKAPDRTARKRKAQDWPVRAADFDTAGHMNNTVYWAAVEDVIAGTGWRPGHALMEYHRPVLPGSRPELLTETDPPCPDGPGHVRAWLTENGNRFASASLRP
ncbi:MAG: acyl-ACP thioesterase domain-containing protein, partial [Trebonia sp.]